jgi:hypothetical protein
VCIYGDCARFFRPCFVVGSFRQNRHRNLYYDALTAALSFLIVTIQRRDTAHGAKASTVASEYSFYISCRRLYINTRSGFGLEPHLLADRSGGPQPWSSCFTVPLLHKGLCWLNCMSEAF